MLIRIKDDAGPVYIAWRNKPFATAGETVNVKKDVGEALIRSGVAMDVKEVDADE